MADSIWAIPLALNNFNILVALLGGWIAIFGLVSYLLKENYYLSEALISLLFGVAFGPNAANWIRPTSYADCQGLSDSACDDRLNAITLNFSRLVLAVQLVLAGVQLPSKYLWTELKPILLLIGPIMTCMWLATSLLVWGLVQPPTILHALAVGACVTPTDPVLSAVIVKGKFANHNIPKDLQNLIIAESGANDGLGYPFLFIALYLIKFVGAGATHGNAGDALGLWFGMTIGYVIILSVIYGAVVGFIAKELLYLARRKQYVDDESFLVFAIALALFILGTCGMLGTDDILACFIAGNTFTWDDWFRLETQDDSLQPTIDMLLNVVIFIWYGAVIPWTSFGDSSVIPIYRLIPLGVLVLLLRRLPWVFGVHKLIHQIQQTRQAIFVGFFGPIGVSAVFYLFITLDFIEEHLSDENGVVWSEVKDLAPTVKVVVWFLAVCSIIVHGLSIPLGKIGYLLPRTISRALTISDGEGDADDVSGAPLRSRRRISVINPWLGGRRRNSNAAARGQPRQPPPTQSPTIRISAPTHPRKLLASGLDGAVREDTSGSSRSQDPGSGMHTPVWRGIRVSDELPRPVTDSGANSSPGLQTPRDRGIRFADEPPRTPTRTPTTPMAGGEGDRAAADAPPASTSGLGE